MYKAVIFDLDGTLMNTIADMGNSMNRSLEKRGLPTHTLVTYQTFVGNGIPKLAERSMPEGYGDFEGLLQDFLDDYAHHYADDSEPYDTVVATLTTLNERNVPIAIATNKKQEYTDGIVEAYLGDIDFVAVIGDQFDGKHKPNPHYPLSIAQTMGVDPSEILFVGDSDVDMKTAANAGMTPIGVAWGFRAVEELKIHGASQILASMDEILAFF